MADDPNECKVYCLACNGYLYALSRQEPLARGLPSIGVPCAYRCTASATGINAMTGPDEK